MIKWYKGKKRWISMILCLIICMQTTIKIQAAAPGYFDNPQTIYNEFKGKIVDISYEKQYAFLKNKMNVYLKTSAGYKGKVTLYAKISCKYIYYGTEKEAQSVAQINICQRQLFDLD